MLNSALFRRSQRHSFLRKNERFFQKKSSKNVKFDDTFSENPDPEGKLAQPTNIFDLNEESQEKFLASLGPELQDLYHKGAMGEIDEHEIAKYMRNMTPEEIQRITNSPAFTEFLGSDSKLNLPSSLDPDAPLSRYFI